MLHKLLAFIQNFGFLDGTRFFIKRIFKKDGHYHSKKFNCTIFLRKKFADNYTFKQVFVENQYGFDIPFVPKTILDGGANIGLAAIYFSNRFPDSTIVSVEPSSENVEILKKNTSNFPNVQVKLGGIWNDDKHLIIVNSTENDNAFMVEEVLPQIPGSIPSFSIASIMREQQWKTIDLLKLDIEGSEKEVFDKNYETWLPNTKMLVIELHDRMRKGSSKSLFKAICQYNFSFDMNHENLIFINQDL